ncbi:MAG: 2-phospho-L-lactate guanylyltransferase [Gammaproteobacteria bacterium]|nr:2-phospho-L-lactate guanylyltransferase [Gammaproteobacteria bacterium]
MTNPCWALVPIKGREKCKSRLAGRLGAEARLSLVRTMLGHVLERLSVAAVIDRIAVVSPERDDVPLQFEVLGDAGGGLNAALHDAQRIAVARGASGLVILPADLPLLTVADIDALVERGQRAGFALAADEEGTGTNGLYVMPATGFRFQFGPASRERHVAEAMRLGLPVEIIESGGLQFDVDSADDLIRLDDHLRSWSRRPPERGNEKPWLTERRTG